MTATSFNPDNNFDELVFENRNKEYGAYVIRRDYNNTVSRSLLITFGAICILVIVAFLFNKSSLVAKLEKFQQQVITPVVIDPSTLTPKDPDPLPKEKTTPTATPPKTDVVSGEVSDKPSDDNIKPNTDATVVMGDPKGKADSTARDIPEIIVRKPEPPVITEPKIIVDEMPELKDLNRIISQNLNYPELAKENDTFGTVYVSFVVETDGSVSNVKVLRGVADGCTEEAVRVVSALPKWKPGKNHGEPVRVLFNLPIKFTLQ